MTLVGLAAVTFLGMTRPPITHEITLFVATGSIDQSNLDQSCNFGQATGVSNRDYTIEVQLGDVVIWKGVSSSAPDTDEVQITAINHEGGARVFGKNVLKDTKSNPGVVQATVTEGKAGDEEKYKVQFRVFNNGQKRKGTFNIDPKIQIKGDE